ncbi:MAG: PIG-L family deacetylase, partial [Bryobacteraceae bacterium]
AMVEAATLLGAEAVLLGYPDAEIPASEEAILTVCDLVRRHQPDIVVTHWNGSWHKDHRNTFQIVRDALFYAALDAMPRALPAHAVGKVFFADNWEDATNYVPDTFLNVTPVYDCWRRACEVFPMWRGETGLIRYNDYYQSLAVMRGSLAGFKYAVALMSDPEQRIRKCDSLSDLT